MRNMSFSMTTEAVRSRTKTVTRRLGWWDLKPGTLLCAVEKAQGLKKGEKVVRLAVIRVVSVRREPLAMLWYMGADERAAELAKEGFPDYELWEFCSLFVKWPCPLTALPDVNRVEFEYVDDPTTCAH